MTYEDERYDRQHEQAAHDREVREEWEQAKRDEEQAKRDEEAERAEDGHALMVESGFGFDFGRGYAEWA